MTFDDKVSLREKLLNDFAKAGKATSRQILEADFGTAAEKYLTSHDPKLNEPLKIDRFNNGKLNAAVRAFNSSVRYTLGRGRLLSAQIAAVVTVLSPFSHNPFINAGVGIVTTGLFNFRQFWKNEDREKLEEGYFTPGSPKSIFINAGKLDNHPQTAMTVSHENVHYLQNHFGMTSGFGRLSSSEINLPVSPDIPDYAMQHALYLASEIEIMPRLHQIVSSFCMMGGKKPRNGAEFQAFLFASGIYDVGDFTSRRLAEGLISEIPEADLEQSYDRFLSMNEGNIREIRVALSLSKPETVPKVMAFLTNSFLNLTKIYGREVGKEQLTLGLNVQLTRKPVFPIVTLS